MLVQDALEAEDREKDRFGDRVLDPYAFPLLLGVPALVVALMYAWKKYRDFAKVELSPEVLVYVCHSAAVSE